LQSTDQLRIDTPEQIVLELPLAGIGSRFLSLAIDTLIQTTLYVVVFLGVVFLAPGIRFKGLFSWVPSSLALPLVIIFLFCVYWGYFAFFEVIWKGRTPGKRIVGIRVIKDSGRPINIFEAIGRNLMRAIDSLPTMYAVGIVCMLLNDKNRRLGDYVAGTLVVHEKATWEMRPDWSLSGSSSAGNAPLVRIGAEELVLIESYLHRRLDLDHAVRDNTAYQIASRITLKTGIKRADNESLDEFLESIARRARDTARFQD